LRSLSFSGVAITLSPALLNSITVSALTLNSGHVGVPTGSGTGKLGFLEA